VTVNQDTSGSWLFSATNSNGAFNQEHMSFSAPNIVARPGFTISPSDTLHAMPWGVDGGNANSNTQVISMNNHVRGMTASGDVRANYVMTGATWTAFGVDPTVGSQVGTNRMANTTMETYQQTTNCFDCHQGTMLDGLSHIYGDLKPLF
jgi:hypothetical protein